MLDVFLKAHCSDRVRKFCWSHSRLCFVWQCPLITFPPASIHHVNTSRSPTPIHCHSLTFHLHPLCGLISCHHLQGTEGHTGHQGLILLTDWLTDWQETRIQLLGHLLMPHSCKSSRHYPYIHLNYDEGWVYWYGDSCSTEFTLKEDTESGPWRFRSLWSDEKIMTIESYRRPFCYPLCAGDSFVISFYQFSDWVPRNLSLAYLMKAS